MVGPNSRLRCRHDDVLARVIDGEAVIINLSNGMYYTLDRAGAVMWELIERGYQIGEVADAIATAYNVSRAVAHADALRLAGELLAQELVVESQEPVPARPVAAAASAATASYAPPTLHAYTDMEDLLALDPPTPGFADIPWKA